MDDVEIGRLQTERDECVREFAALFAQLDTTEAVAPIDHGLMQLLNRIAGSDSRRGHRSRH